MTATNTIEIPVVQTPEKSNFPFVVEGKNTDNFNAIKSAVTIEAAREIAQALIVKYPKLSIRIAHHTGGFLIVDTLPLYQTRTAAHERPYRHALWTGFEKPPAINDRVFIKINSIGWGMVKSYTVMEGYLGVMILADEETRPAWHKKQNPTNKPMLTFGAELGTAPLKS